MKNILDHKLTQKTLALAFVTLLLIQFFQQFFTVFDSDELQHLFLAWNQATGTQVFSELFDHHGYIYTYLNSILFQVHNGQNYSSLTSLRLYSFLFVLLYLYFSYKITVNFTSKTFGFITLLLLQTNPAFTLFSGDIRPDVLLNVAILASIYLLIKKRLIFSGFLLGLAFFLHPKSIFSIVAILFFIIVNLRENKKFLIGFFISTLLNLAFLSFNGILSEFFYYALNYNFELFVSRPKSDTPTFSLNFFLYNVVSIILYLTFLINFTKKKKFEIVKNTDYLILMCLPLVNFVHVLSAQYPYVHLSIIPYLIIIAVIALYRYFEKKQMNSFLLLFIFLSLINLGFHSQLKFGPTKNKVKQRQELEDFKLLDYKEALPVFNYNCIEFVFSKPFHKFWYWIPQAVPANKNLKLRDDYFPRLKSQINKIDYILGLNEMNKYIEDDSSFKQIKSQYERVSSCLHKRKK